MITHTEALRRRRDAIARRSPRVSVVVPTLNEARNLPHVFPLLPADIHEVILVDGRSVDGTIDVATSLRPDITVVRQTRKGKGNAMACGFAAVTGDIVVMLDADGSADPREIPLYVEALMNGADFAKGTRFVREGGSSDITRLRRIGNWGLNTLVNILYRTKYTDLCYGYNAFWVTCLPILQLDPGEQGSQMRWGDGFEIETIINTRIARANLKISEVASFEHARVHGESNLNTFSDGFRVLKAIARERRERARLVPVTAPSSATLDLTALTGEQRHAPSLHTPLAQQAAERTAS